ncbi:MAG: hypothetical protein JRF33_11045 [Deltaproteobacteria bacterium]|nr:hypothetical protein [Deltaproteobacteria bacterium]
MQKDAEDRKLSRIERHYRDIFSHLDPSLLTDASAESPWPEHPASEGDPNLAPSNDSDDFLGFYSHRGVEVVFERYGLFKKLQGLGFDQTHISLAHHQEGYDILRVRSPKSKHPLMELVARLAALPSEVREPSGLADRQFLNVKWLRMQNPLAPVDQNKPLLPGQAFPGLGLGREMMALIQMICVRLDLDGVYELPERLHNASLYFRRFRFPDPEMQGRFTAILRDTQSRTLPELAWGVEYGMLTDLKSGKAFRWIPSEQVLARTGPVLDFLDGKDYRKRAKASMDACRFSLSEGDLASDLAGLNEEDNPIPSRLK